MKIFVAGATGVMGRQLVPRLVAAGHEVHGMMRSADKSGLLEALGGVPIVADALDRAQTIAAVGKVRPDVIVHELTAIAVKGTRNLEQSFAGTNALRTRGTDNLLAAAKAVGCARFVAQSNVAIYARTGGPVKTECDALDEDPPPDMAKNQEALKHLENAVLAAPWTTGIVLRYGWFYGPGTTLTMGADTFEMIRKGRFPVVGKGEGIWSFVHIADAADATLAGIERGQRGAYNVVDDEPAAVNVWLPALAQQLGGRRPWRVPRWVGKMFVGGAGVALMTEQRGASNAKARRELGWVPVHPTWRRGFTLA